MLNTQALSAAHRPWPISFHIHPLTRSLASSANSTPGRTSISFQRITPISSCCHYSRIGSNGLNPRYVVKRSAMTRRPALPVPATYHRLWSELFSHPSSYSFPSSFCEFSSRIRRNLNLFRQNYESIFMLALLLGLLWNPNSIIMLLSALRLALAQMVATDVWLMNVLVSLLIGVGIVVLHATFWKSEKDFTLLGEEEAVATAGSASVDGPSPISKDKSRLLGEEEAAATGGSPSVVDSNDGPSPTGKGKSCLLGEEEAVGKGKSRLLGEEEAAATGGSPSLVDSNNGPSPITDTGIGKSPWWTIGKSPWWTIDLLGNKFDIYFTLFDTYSTVFTLLPSELRLSQQDAVVKANKDNIENSVV